MSLSDFHLQTGDLNKPQIISFDSLFSTFSIQNQFDIEKVEKMTFVLDRWKTFSEKHFTISVRDRNSVAYYICDIPRLTRRTAHVELPITPGIIYKAFSPNSSSLHPMATTLRAPMASLIQQTITENDLFAIGVPRKGLFSLFSKEVVAGLNENTINEAFVVCVEKIDAYNPAKTREIINEWSEDRQKTLADQCCALIEKTGLCDFMWENLQMHKESSKLYTLDTETLEYELFIDQFGNGFETCAEMVKISTLRKCAKSGLNWFQKSSNLYHMDIFENTATSRLEKID